MATRGPALSFDPQYVDFVISAWRERDLPTLTVEGLQRLAAEHAEAAFAELTMMGLAEERVKQPAIKSSLALLKSLKLVKQTSSGSGAARVVKASATPLGREVLTENPAVGNIRVAFVGLLVESSPPLTGVLRSLDEGGPLSRPVASPLPGTPGKGTAFNRALLEGLGKYDSRGSASTPNSARTGARQTATQLLKAAATRATGLHPVSAVPSVEKILALAADLGLLWRDVEQINQALGVESIGLAASTREGAFIPHVPTWQDIEARFEETLWHVYLQRVDSSGFTTIGALRGGIGRELHISAPVVDAFLHLAREAGDRGESSVSLQFEPNDDLRYAANRRPLIWQGHAFDFVEVRRPANALPTVGSPFPRRQTGAPPSS